MTRREHWEQVYQTKPDKDLSWFQSDPAVSLALIDSLPQRPACAVDVGGGQSRLAASLVERGVPSVTVLDISSAALQRARERQPAVADRITWVQADVLQAPSGPAVGSLPSFSGPFDLWHDRAVFHFLTDANDRRRYVETALRMVLPGGHFVIATFALTGPEKCSGLPVCRYDAAALAAEFGLGVRMVTSRTETHTTPWGKQQEFTYVLLRRTAAH